MNGPQTPVSCVCLRSVLNYSRGKSRKPFPFIWVTNYKLLGWWRVSIGGRLRAKATLSACFRNYEGWVGPNFHTIIPLSRRNCLITSSFGKLSIQNQLLSIHIWTKLISHENTFMNHILYADYSVWGGIKRLLSRHFVHTMKSILYFQITTNKDIQIQKEQRKRIRFRVAKVIFVLMKQNKPFQSTRNSKVITWLTGHTRKTWQVSFWC